MKFHYLKGARTDLTSGQNVQKLSTAEEIGKQYGVDEKTVRRDADFSEAVDKVMGLRCLRGASNEAPKTEVAGFQFRKRPGCTNVPAEAGVFSREEKLIAVINKDKVLPETLNGTK